MLGGPAAADLYRWKTAIGGLSLELPFAVKSEVGMKEGKNHFHLVLVLEMGGTKSIKEMIAAFL